MNEHTCTRREFFVGAAKVVALVGVATILSPEMIHAKDKSIVLNIDLTNPTNAPLAKVGGALMLDNPKNEKNKIIVYRKSETEVIAVSSLCTHANGPLSLPDSKGVMTCPWHKATFDLDGKVIKGPTNKPLQKFKAAVNGTVVTVTI